MSDSTDCTKKQDRTKGNEQIGLSESEKRCRRRLGHYRKGPETRETLRYDLELALHCYGGLVEAYVWALQNMPTSQRELHLTTLPFISDELVANDVENELEARS